MSPIFNFEPSISSDYQCDLFVYPFFTATCVIRVTSRNSPLRGLTFSSQRFPFFFFKKIFFYFPYNFAIEGDQPQESHPHKKNSFFLGFFPMEGVCWLPHSKLLEDLFCLSLNILKRGGRVTKLQTGCEKKFFFGLDIFQ